MGKRSWVDVDGDDDGCDVGIIIIICKLQDTEAESKSSRWKGEAEDEARWIIKKNEKRRTDSHGRKSGKMKR